MKRNLVAAMLVVLLFLTPKFLFASDSESSNQNEQTNVKEDVEATTPEKVKATEHIDSEPFEQKEQTNVKGDVETTKPEKVKATEIEEVVITATRLDTPSSEVASSITVITNRQIEEQQKTTVLEVLREVPALDVVQAGGPGRMTSVFIRGANSEHTLVVLDGVEMNDPITPGGGYDFANLTTDNIERIEIIRGPQSTLYGSDAVGGVINIITKKGKGEPSGFVSAEGGSFKTFIEKGGVSGGNKWINYSLGLYRWDTEGISAANQKDGNREKDGYGSTSASVRLGVTPVEYFDVDFIFRYIAAKADIDNHGGVGGDDPNSTVDSKQLFFRTQARLSLFDDLWEQKLGFSLSKHDSDYHNDKDADHVSDLSRSTFEGQIVNFDWQHNLHIHRTNILTLGVETQEQQGKSDYYSESAWGPYSSSFKNKTARRFSYYLQDKIRLWDSWFTTLGVRADDYGRLGTDITYRITSAYLIRQIGTKIKGTYGTGFKAPTIYQLYSQYGDENLKPEKSTGWDVGVEQSLLGEKLTMGATYFRNELNQLIDFDSGTSKYKNVAKAETSGVELFMFVRPIDDLTIRVSYTYTDTKDKSTGEELLRRPRNKFGFDLNYRFLEKGNVNLSVLYVGKRDDNDYSTSTVKRVVMDDYVLANLAASYQITKNFQIFGRIENLFDADYEEVKGFGMPGISAFGGLKISF